jgi:hypothetical protein
MCRIQTLTIRNLEGKIKGMAPRAVQVSVCTSFLWAPMPCRDGAITAPSACAATILEAPDCQTHGQLAIPLATTTMRPEGIDHGA